MRLAFAVPCLLIILSLGCGRGPSVPTEYRLVGQAAPLLAMLDQCAAVSASQVARDCSTLAEKVRPCEAVTASCSAAGEGCSLADEVQCVAPSSVLSERAGSAGTGSVESGWRFTGPLPSVIGRGSFVIESASGEGESTTAPLDVDVILQLSRQGAAARWLPTATQRGLGLSASNAFLQLRYRPAGGLVMEREGEQTLADRMYGLRSELFSAAVLSGDVELLVLTPAPGEQFPSLVAALDFRLRAPAVAAMESYIKDLQTQWPITRLDYRASSGLGVSDGANGGEGACLSNLQLMPGLAPCYVATESAIVVGWNREALESVLPYRPTNASGGNQALIDFDWLGVADQRIASTRNRAVAFDYPEGRLSIAATELSDPDGALRFSLRQLPSSIEGAGGASGRDAEGGPR